MSCSERWPADVAERYLQGRLDEEEASAYEDHFFECEACFAALSDLRALQDGLSRTRRAVEARPWIVRPPRWVAAAAAVLVLGLAVAFWLPRRAPTPPPSADAGSRAVTVAAPAPGASSLAELARVEAPPWTPTRLRGPESEASRRFRDAMEPYAKGDWGAALPLLREAARLQPEAADAAFYRGACALLVGHREEAVESLRRVVALGETPFLEEARFYLAKAYLGAGEIEPARQELNAVVGLDGERRETARQILERLEATKG